MLKFSCQKLSHLLPLLFLIFPLNAQESEYSSKFNDFSEVTDYLLNLRPIDETAEITSEIIIKKDAAIFKLKEGKIFKCSDYKGHHYSIAFLGEGEFTFTPPNTIEKKQLFRFTGAETLQQNFSQLFILFDDSTFEEIESRLTFQKGSKSREAEDLVKSCLTYFKEEAQNLSRVNFIRSVLAQGRNGFCYLQFQSSKLNSFFFEINPYDDEAVSFMKRYQEVINLFPAQRETLVKYSEKMPQKYFLNLISYKIESTIEDNLDFSAKCIIDFTSTEKNQNWILFYLYDKLLVDSVKWDDNSKARFINPKESGELWIFVDSTFLEGNQHYVTIFYHGELLGKNDLGWIYLNSSNFWYPRYDNNTKVPFGLIFHTPVKYDFISVGDLTSTVEHGEVRTTTWFCNTPIRNASFNIGNFDVFNSNSEIKPEVKVFISKYGHNQVSKYFNQLGIYSVSDASEYIANDITNSVKLFNDLFGGIQIKSLNITETPYLHGEAFPGLIHLSWATVIQTNFEGEDEIFRAHEVAHQWWGIGVDFKTYHDQWISEGFSEYSGLWYLQAVKNNNELFFDVLKDWKDQILNVRKYLFGSGQEAGPIWLGYRTSSSNTIGDYDLVVYKKGAWVLHMLRGMLLDLNTMNEDRIKNLIREFHNTYKNKNASTNDFKKIVDKHFGEDMSWFFDQYVYGTEIPLYKVAYKSEDTEDGKIKVSIRVRQEEVSDNFKMYVPVKIVLDGDRIGRIRIEVKGKETIFTSPPIDGELEEIIFNDLESVLCSVEYEDW